MVGSENRVHLSLQEPEKILDIKAMPRRPERREISLGQPKQPHRRIHPPPILRVRRSRILFLQMDEPACRLDQPFEIIRILRFCPQPEVLEHIVRFVIALLIPATEKTDVAWMPGNFGRRLLRRRAAQLFYQSGNSLAFVHGKLSLVSAEMTGNRAPIVFPRRADVRTATGDG